jgi:hypothetical protein
MTIEGKVTGLEIRKEVKYAVISVPDMRYREQTDRMFVLAEDLQLGDSVTLEIQKIQVRP